MTAYPTDLAALVGELVRRESENPPGNERPVAEYVHAWFGAHGIESTLLEEPDPDRPGVGARVGGVTADGSAGGGSDDRIEGDGSDDRIEGERGGGPTLVLNGHTDVVPAGDPDVWSHDPYEPVVEDGRLYGRGAADMKSGLAVAMLAALELAPEIRAGELAGSLVVHAAMGEETGEPGTKALLEAGFDGTYGVVLEPTACRVATAAKGLAWYDLSIPGEPVHASQPDRGHNAVGDVAAVLDRIEAYDAELRARGGGLCGPAYATVTQVVGGADTNRAVFPDEVTLVLDRRIEPTESVADVDREVAAIAEELRAEGIALEWERETTYESASIPVDSPLAERFRDVSATHTGASTDPWGIEASTDVRNFVNDAGMEAITWGPGSLEQAHTVDEHVVLADVEAGYDALLAAARELLG